MTLAYKSAGTPGLFTVLADEADRTTTREVAAPGYTRQAQVEALVRAESVTPFDRGNVAVALAVTATITYASKAAALLAEYTMATLFTGRNHLRLAHGTTTIYYPNAVCQGYTPERRGNSVTHQLQFIAQLVTTTEP